MACNSKVLGTFGGEADESEATSVSASSLVMLVSTCFLSGAAKLS